MKLIAVFVALVLFVLGCGGDPPSTPVPTRTPTATPASTSTPTVTPTVATPEPTVSAIQAIILARQQVVQILISPTPRPEGAPSVLQVQATSTPIVLSMNPSNIILELPPTPTPTPTTVPTPTPTLTPIPPTPTPTPVIFVGTVDVHLTLPVAPNGVAGYIFDVVVGPHVILSDFKTVFSLVDRVGNQIRAADIAEVVEPGAVNVTLATLTFEAVAPGAGPIQIDIIMFDDDDGFPINARFEPGFIEVR